MTVGLRQDLARIDMGLIPGYNDKQDLSDDQAEEGELAKVDAINNRAN